MLIYDYFSSNFITLTILSTVFVMMLVNRKLKVPATKMFYAAIALILALSVLEFLDYYFAGELSQKPSFDTIMPRTVTETLIYSFRPLFILSELLIILPNRRCRLLCTLPAIVNIAVYLTALFGSDIAFSITENGWSRGPLGLCVYVVQIVYVIILFICSVYSLGHRSSKHGVIILLILMTAILTAVMEYKDILTGYTTVVSAMGVLFYYFYLAIVHQQSMQATIEEKELNILEQELTLLRGQIDPVIISGSLNCIRSLAKTDKTASAAAIDSFSVYLRAHINAIRDDKPTSFETELDCTIAYLSLLHLKERITVELERDLQTTVFSLPPLTLEAAVTYCVDCVQSNEQRILIRTEQDDDETRVTVSGEAMTDAAAIAVPTGSNALENARRRLEVQCGGTLTVENDENGVALRISIPLERAV